MFINRRGEDKDGKKTSIADFFKKKWDDMPIDLNEEITSLKNSAVLKGVYIDAGSFARD